MMQLYRYFDNSGTLLYVGISFNAFVRAAQHKDTAEWFSAISTMTVENFPTREAALEAETAAIETERPVHNKQISLRKPKPTHGDLMADCDSPEAVAYQREARAKAEGARIRHDYEHLCSFSWGQKAAVIERYINYLRTTGGDKAGKKAFIRATKRLEEVRSYFERNPHRF